MAFDQTTKDKGHKLLDIAISRLEGGITEGVDEILAMLADMVRAAAVEACNLGNKAADAGDTETADTYHTARDSLYLGLDPITRARGALARYDAVEDVGGLLDCTGLLYSVKGVLGGVTGPLVGTRSGSK
ncbi:MAG: hypothetical protein Unbinned7865contig1001_53 [Prokaryotic dsDNA virus sp.]|nr:MAG: hypothetical protein Unbinned7865contig1001_53 [Prokaryotic dsDNA virus sp.]|tara:strand:- start:367 stop:756 length:390 start_codon:yes stop_codon:yes gene_type:complete